MQGSKCPATTGLGTEELSPTRSKSLQDFLPLSDEAFVSAYNAESPDVLFNVIATRNANPAEASILANYNPVQTVYMHRKKSNPKSPKGSSSINLRSRDLG